MYPAYVFTINGLFPIIHNIQKAPEALQDFMAGTRLFGSFAEAERYVEFHKVAEYYNGTVVFHAIKLMEVG